MVGSKHLEIPSGTGFELDFNDPTQCLMEVAGFYKSIQIMAFGVERHGRTGLQPLLDKQRGMRGGDLFQIGHDLIEDERRILIKHIDKFRTEVAGLIGGV